MKPALSILEGAMERKRRADVALQEAWDERARAHELLTRACISEGGLVNRLRLLLKRLHELEAEVAYLKSRPTDGAL